MLLVVLASLHVAAGGMLVIFGLEMAADSGWARLGRRVDDD